MTAAIDKLRSQVDVLSQEQIGTREGAEVLKAISRIGRLGENEFTNFVSSCSEDKKPLVYKLREQAKVALLAVAGGKEALDAADLAVRAKEELLMKEMGAENFRHLLGDVSQDEKIDILRHAKRGISKCSFGMQSSLIQLIKQIPQKEREGALKRLPEFLDKVVSQEYVERESTLILVRERANEGAVGELIDVLLMLPTSGWYAVLKTNKNLHLWLEATKRAMPIIQKNQLGNRWEIERVIAFCEEFSEEVIQASLPLMESIKEASHAYTILKCVQLEEKAKRAEIVSFVCRILRPFKEPHYLIELAFTISRHPLAGRFGSLIDSMVLFEVPWTVLFDMHRIVTKDPELIEKIANLIKINTGTGIALAAEINSIEFELNFSKSLGSLHV